MKEGVLLYFSEEEFALMMELAGGKEYTLFLTEPDLDDRRLTEAFASLFQRGLLIRVGDDLVPSEKGAFFRGLRDASFVVLLRKESPKPKMLLCYVQGETLWIAELLDGSPLERYRLSTRRSGEMKKWLLDIELLPRPMLRDEDTKELKIIFADDLNQETDDNVIVRIEKYSCSGIRLCEYVLHHGRAGQILRSSDTGNTEIQLYTQDVLNEMLRQCFGG